MKPSTRIQRDNRRERRHGPDLTLLLWCAVLGLLRSAGLLKRRQREERKPEKLSVETDRDFIRYCREQEVRLGGYPSWTVF